MLIFFIPKINIISLSSLVTAGLRVDDILVFYVFVSLLGSKIIDKRIMSGIMIMLSIAGLSMIAMFFHAHKVRFMFSILSIIRRFEYFSMILAGYYVRKNINNFDKFFHRTFAWLHFALMFVALLQVTGLTNNIALGRQNAGIYGKMAVATFNGYYEYGQFLVFGYLYYLMRWLNFGLKLKDMRMMIMITAFILLTGSRSSMMWAGLVTVMIVWFSHRVKVSYKLAMSLLIASGAIIFIIVGAGGSDIFKRFRTVDISNMLSALRYYLQTGDFEAYLVQADRGFNVGVALDMSAAVRFYKWGIALDGLMRYPLLGYGYGIVSPGAMDGNYVRTLGEIGILGMLLWLRLYFGYMRYFFRNSDASFRAETAAWMMVALAFGAIFIDNFDASKIMEFIWFYAGIAIYDIRQHRLGIQAKK